MIVYGIDCSTKKIAIFKISDGEVKCAELVADNVESSVRIDSMFKDLIPLFDELKPNMVYIENSPYLQNIKVTLAIHSAVDAVRFACVLNNIPYQTVEVTSWKKDVLGNGKADKAQIMSWAKAKYGDLITSQDLADAAGIANYGYRRMAK
jgi:Holliday junction resolvasome RuvABC endonuclease subunit